MKEGAKQVLEWHAMILGILDFLGNQVALFTTGEKKGKSFRA